MTLPVPELHRADSAGQVQCVRSAADHDDSTFVRKRLQQHALFFLALSEEKIVSADREQQHGSDIARHRAAHLWHGAGWTGFG